MHSGDRNRTSPFAFTGNKFEFRAVGSNQSIASPLMVLNTIVAESLDYMATKLENAKGDFDDAVQALLKEVITEHDRIIFNGDGYSEAWHKEAEKRGLPNMRTTYDALPASADEEAVALFSKYGVMSEREVKSRLDVHLEQYNMAVNVEAKLMIEMARTMIYPAAVRYQGELAKTAADMKVVGVEPDTEILTAVTACATALKNSVNALEALMKHGDDDLFAEAKHFCFEIVPAMATVRKYADALENLVADDLWPLPTYQEMLFIK
jgi:glutamine synthetase